MYYSVYLSVYMCIIFTQVPKELGSMDHLELELQKAVTSMMWVLCAELWLSATAVPALNSGGIAPVLT